MADTTAAQRATCSTQTQSGRCTHSGELLLILQPIETLNYVVNGRFVLRSRYATDHDDEMTVLRLAHTSSGGGDTDVSSYAICHCLSTR